MKTAHDPEHLPLLYSVSAPWSMQTPGPRKRKLLVILGAGSSIPCGMPSVAMIDGAMKQWSRDWKRPPEFPEGTGRGIFNDLWEIVESYYRENPRPQLGIRINYERVLGEMVALGSWVTPSPFGNPLQMAVQNRQPSSRFTWPLGHEEPFFYRQLILEQSSFLLDRLAAFMRERSAALDVASDPMSRYRAIFLKLREEFEIGVYNLNYDNVAYRVWPDAFTGFASGKFDGRAVGLRGEWNFIYHLHGSVHWSFCDPPFKLGMEWIEDLRGTFENCRPAFPSMASEFKAMVPTTLIAGGFKLDQLLIDPFQTFHASLVRHAHEADAVLIIGYGFGDVHVNRALQNRFDLSPYDASRRPPVVVIEKTPPDRDTMANRQGYEFWAWELTHALNTRFQMSAPPPGNALKVGEFVHQKRFEVDSYERLAIWHGGFLEALSSIDEIVARLHR